MTNRKPVNFAPQRAAMSVGSWIFGASFVGLTAGAGSLLLTPEGRASFDQKTETLAVDMGFKRAREPQAGDYWPGCNSARDAGTALIYSGEPGYRTDMDGDGDGIACEPHN